MFPLSIGGRSDAIPGHDYDFLNISLEAVVFNFTIDPGATRNFEIIVIDDRIAEDMHYETMTYYVGIYEFGISEFCDVSIFVIEDDDGNSSNLRTYTQPAFMFICSYGYCIQYFQVYVLKCWYLELQYTKMWALCSCVLYTMRQIMFHYPSQLPLFNGTLVRL